MASTLPNNPSLDRLRADARRLQREITTNRPEGFELVRAHHPRPDAALAGAPDRFALHDAQLIVARKYGFAGRPALVHFLEITADLATDPSAIDEDALNPADRFCSMASRRYDHTDAPPRRQAAADLLAAEPGLVEQHVWAAASAADPVALERHVAARPDQATAAGGPFGWVPLLYLCYSRIPLPRSQDEVLAATRLLLDSGADPNAGYLWCGMSTPLPR